MYPDVRPTGRTHAIYYITSLKGDILWLYMLWTRPTAAYSAKCLSVRRDVLSTLTFLWQSVYLKRISLTKLVKCFSRTTRLLPCAVSSAIMRTSVKVTVYLEERALLYIFLLLRIISQVHMPTR